MEINKTKTSNVETKETVIKNVFTLAPDERLEQFDLGVDDSLANKVKEAIKQDNKVYLQKRKNTILKDLQIVLNFFKEINKFIPQLDKNQSYFLNFNQEKKIKSYITHNKNYKLLLINTNSGEDLKMLKYLATEISNYYGVGCLSVPFLRYFSVKINNCKFCINFFNDYILKFYQSDDPLYEKYNLLKFEGNCENKILIAFIKKENKKVVWSSNNERDKDLFEKKCIYFYSIEENKQTLEQIKSDAEYERITNMNLGTHRDNMKKHYEEIRLKKFGNKPLTQSSILLLNFVFSAICIYFGTVPAIAYLVMRQFEDNIKSIQEKSMPKKGGSKINKERHFRVCKLEGKNIELGGVSISSKASPGSAARKLLTSIAHHKGLKKNKKASMSKVKYCIQEYTQGSSKKIYGPYVGHYHKYTAAELKKAETANGKVKFTMKPVVKLVKGKNNIKV